MRTLFGAALAVGVALAAAAGADDKPARFDVKKLVGKWEPAKPRPDTPEIVYEFTKDGKMAMVPKGTDPERAAKGTYKLDGNRLALTAKGVGEDGKDAVLTVTVTKLTDDELEVTVGGKPETYKRVKEKDKK